MLLKRLVNLFQLLLQLLFPLVGGLGERVHTPPHGVELYEENGFEWGAWQEWDAAKAFRDDSFIFTVIQSIGGAPPEWVAEQVEPYLNMSASH